GMQQLRVEPASGLRPLAAAEQRDRTGSLLHGSDPTGASPGTTPGRIGIPAGNLAPFRGGASMAIKRVGIVGSGIMGSGVAEVAAKAGIEVVLRSRAQATADAMVAGLEKSLAKQVERGKLEESDRDAVLGRVRAVTDLGEL